MNFFSPSHVINKLSRHTSHLAVIHKKTLFETEKLLPTVLGRHPEGLFRLLGASAVIPVIPFPQLLIVTSSTMIHTLLSGFAGTTDAASKLVNVA